MWLSIICRANVGAVKRLNEAICFGVIIKMLSRVRFWTQELVCKGKPWKFFGPTHLATTDSI
jgi:hypothetical protein